MYYFKCENQLNGICISDGFRQTKKMSKPKEKQIAEAPEKREYRHISINKRQKRGNYKFRSR